MAVTGVTPARTLAIVSENQSTRPPGTGSSSRRTQRADACGVQHHHPFSWASRPSAADACVSRALLAADLGSSILNEAAHQHRRSGDLVVTDAPIARHTRKGWSSSVLAAPSRFGRGTPLTRFARCDSSLKVRAQESSADSRFFFSCIASVVTRSSRTGCIAHRFYHGPKALSRTTESVVLGCTCALATYTLLGQRLSLRLFTVLLLVSPFAFAVTMPLAHLIELCLLVSRQDRAELVALRAKCLLSFR